MTEFCAASHAELEYNSAYDESEERFNAFVRSFAFDLAVDEHIEKLVKNPAIFWEAFGPDALPEQVVPNMFETVVAKQFLERKHQDIGKAFFNLAINYLRPIAVKHVEENWRDYQ